MPLTNSQYDSILRQYDAKQSQNRQIAEERTTKLYQQEPRLGELDRKISEASLTQAKRLLDGDSSALLHLKAQLKNFQAQKKTLIQDMGYPSDYLNPPYECPDCKDTGYIGNEKCHCFKQAAINLLYMQSNIRQILEEENFDTFSFEFYSEQQKNSLTGLSSLDSAKHAVFECHNFVDNFDQSFENLLLYGDTGIGKTFLSHCIAKELIDSGHSVIYFSSSELFDLFSKKVFDKEVEASEQYRHIFDCDLLIIDDMGTEFSNSFTNSQLFQCLNQRIIQKKSTLISTNLNQEGLSTNYSDRIASRIFSNYTFIKLFGDDIRIKKKLTHFS